MTPDSPAVKPAPYMSFSVFTKSIETFANTTVPSGALDRRVLSEFSGADYGALISGLRFLGLIDDARKATAQYRVLVESWNDKEKFKGLLIELLTDKYRGIAGNVNLKTGTSTELEKAFKDYGVTTGQMLTKTIRFYLKALSEAGVQVGPHITAPKPRTTAATTKKNIAAGKQRSRTKRHEVNPAESIVSQIPAGFERLPIPGMPESFIQYPANLTEAHCQVLEAMVGVLRTSVKTRTGRKET